MLAVIAGEYNSVLYCVFLPKKKKSQEPTAPKSSDVCNYVQTLRKQLSMDYRLSHEMPADRPTKGAKSIKDGGNYVAGDKIVIKITK